MSVSSTISAVLIIAVHRSDTDRASHTLAHSWLAAAADDQRKAYFDHVAAVLALLLVIAHSTLRTAHKTERQLRLRSKAAAVAVQPDATRIAYRSLDQHHPFLHKPSHPAARTDADVACGEIARSRSAVAYR